MSRGKGKSAVAAAAYRSGEKLTNEWDGMTHDYTRKGGVAHTEIMLPPHAPPSFSDRSTLWNSVELYEKAGNAQLAREIDAALPIELSREEQIRLVREYCSSQFVSRGMCVDFAIHDTDTGNPHCHIMLTMRPLNERGAWAAKSKKEYDLDKSGERIRLPSGRYKTHKIDLTGWNDKDNTLLWRKAWADYTNDFLERNGSPERIDHRSNAERGIDEIPTVHMGVAACQMEKKGIATEKGDVYKRQVLDSAKHDYDFILLDCTPSLGMLTVNALAAADTTLIPVQAQYLSAKGLEQLLQTVQKVRRQINPKLKIEGILLTMTDSRTNYGKQISNLIRQAYGKHLKVFEQTIPRSVRAAETSAAGKSIFQHDPKGKVAEAYQSLAKEVLADADRQRKLSSERAR